MNYFPWMGSDYYWGTKGVNQNPKNPNSNSTLRGFERRLEQLRIREQTPRVVKEIKKLHQKIANQKEKIRKRNEEILSS